MSKGKTGAKILNKTVELIRKFCVTTEILCNYRYSKSTTSCYVKLQNRYKQCSLRLSTHSEGWRKNDIDFTFNLFETDWREILKKVAERFEIDIPLKYRKMFEGGVRIKRHR